MIECFCGCGRAVSFTRRSTNEIGPKVADQVQDWEAIHHSAADLEGTIEGFEAFVEEGRWLHANLQAHVHHEPVDPGFSNRDAARWLRLAHHLRTDFGKKVLHEAVAQRLQGN